LRRIISDHPAGLFAATFAPSPPSKASKDWIDTTFAHGTLRLFQKRTARGDGARILLKCALKIL